jgi:hypothetical protein
LFIKLFHDSLALLFELGNSFNTLDIRKQEACQG